MQNNKKQSDSEKERMKSFIQWKRETSLYNARMLGQERKQTEEEKARREKAEEAELGLKVVKSKSENADVSISFFKNSPPKGIANKLYDFISKDEQKVEIFSEAQDLETRTKILMFVRRHFGVLHPDPTTEKEIDEKSHKELLSKLSKSELNEIEFQIKKAKQKKEISKEDEDWLRTELMINQDLENEKIDGEIKDELETFYEGENEHGLLRNTMRENKKLKEKYSRLGWAIFTIVAIAILVIIGILND